MRYENWFVSKSALQQRQKDSILLTNGVRKIGYSYGKKNEISNRQNIQISNFNYIVNIYENLDTKVSRR